MSVFFGSFIVLWSIFLISVIMIGGFFMFRKFLKSMPKQDGMSDLDWQDYYIDQTRSLWSDETLDLLNDLVSPVPELFRDIARRTIASRIGQLALEEKVKSINQDLVIKGYILATPPRDHKWLVEHLNKRQIDFSPYKQLIRVKI